jgi:hypothetical protein
VERAIRVFFMLTCLTLNTQSLVAANAEDYTDKTEQEFLEIQRTLDKLDFENSDEAKTKRSSIVRSLRPLSKEALKAYYQKLPEGAFAFRYACILLAVQKFQINIDPKIKVVESFSVLLSSVNFPLIGPAQGQEKKSTHCELLDPAHAYHVLALIEHIIGQPIKSLNVIKNILECLPITIFQLSNLEVILCNEYQTDEFLKVPRAGDHPKFMKYVYKYSDSKV